jgi:hypothetical protein
MPTTKKNSSEHQSEFNLFGAQFTLIESAGDFAVYRRKEGKYVMYAIAQRFEFEMVPSVESVLFRSLSRALERMDALYAASIGNPLYRSGNMA